MVTPWLRLRSKTTSLDVHGRCVVVPCGAARWWGGLHLTAQPGDHPPPIQVVTCFIRDETGKKVLLARRAATMPTFPGRWAGISGSIEEGELPVSAQCPCAHPPACGGVCMGRSVRGEWVGIAAPRGRLTRVPLVVWRCVAIVACAHYYPWPCVVGVGGTMTWLRAPPTQPCTPQVAAAWREIAEETGLTPQRGGLALVRAGLPVELHDTVRGEPADICVHPFLFVRQLPGGGAGASADAGAGAGTDAGAGAGGCTSGEAARCGGEPTLCREHSSMEWVHPLHVVKKDWEGVTVPGYVPPPPPAPPRCAALHDMLDCHDRAMFRRR